MRLWNLLSLALPWAWLIPNHYPPWPSAWPDGAAIALIGLACLCLQDRGRVAVQWVGFAALVLATVAVQALSGKMHFGGDAWTVACYALTFGCALILGSHLGMDPPEQAMRPFNLFCVSLLSAAMASVAVALLQWTEAASLGIWQAELPPGQRPFGNVAQPNHLCTIAFLGICAAGVLRNSHLIGKSGFWAAGAWMVLGMVMSGSRTGWVQMSCLLIFVFWAGRRLELQISRKGTVGLAAAFAAAVLFWPDINSWLLLDRGRPLADTMSGGTRIAHWWTMLDAIGREPLWGYGWQQVSVAQVRVADSHPFVGEQIEHAHNMVLDLLVWSGIPLGLTLLALALTWYVSRLRAIQDGRVAWLMLAITGLGAHAMLEYPHTYAYFLVPLGLFIGLVDRLQGQANMVLVPANLARLVGLTLLVLLGFIGHDYLQAEQSFRLLRMESAKIGAPGLQTPPPKLLLLNQLEAYQTFVHTEARPGMRADEVDSMRRTAERFATPPALFRYALVAGLNGQPDVAALTLKRLCLIHARPRCQEGRDGWLALQRRYPVLLPIAPPEMP